MKILEFQHPRIKSSSRSTAAAARATVTVLVTDSIVEAKAAAKAWKKARVAGDLVTVRRFVRRVRAAGAAVELHLVVVALRPPSTAAQRERQ